MFLQDCVIPKIQFAYGKTQLENLPGRDVESTAQKLTDAADGRKWVQCAAIDDFQFLCQKGQQGIFPQGDFARPTSPEVRHVNVIITATNIRGAAIESSNQLNLVTESDGIGREKDRTIRLFIFLGNGLECRKSRIQKGFLVSGIRVALEISIFRFTLPGDTGTLYDDLNPPIVVVDFNRGHLFAGATKLGRWILFKSLHIVVGNGPACFFVPEIKVVIINLLVQKKTGDCTAHDDGSIGGQLMDRLIINGCQPIVNLLAQMAFNVSGFHLTVPPNLSEFLPTPTQLLCGSSQLALQSHGWRAFPLCQSDMPLPSTPGLL